MNTNTTLYRATILHFPVATLTPDTEVKIYLDGALVVHNEKIVALGQYNETVDLYKNAKQVDYSGRLITAGLIDSHLHYPQTEMIAKYGEQLLAWLENYTFPTEHKFHSEEYCEQIANIFLRQLIDNGTTTALAFSSVHKQSVDALFNAASALNMQIVTGKVCMDRHCPEYLQDTPASAQSDSNDLIEKWHGKGRNLYALTPRFAPTSSPAQLAALGELAQQHPSTFIQTHLSENKHEVEWVKSLYPTHQSYLDVYASFNMLRKRAVFGHCLHLSQPEWEQLADANASVAFCPSSNLFLGSGLFDIETAENNKVNTVLASDVGAGTSFNMLRTYGEAYKVSQLQQAPISPLKGLYMMTQGPATAYGIADQIGNLNPGSYADFIVLNPHFDALSHLRINETNDPQDILFALSIIGDDRAIEASYIAGKQQKFSKGGTYAVA